MKKRYLKKGTLLCLVALVLGLFGCRSAQLYVHRPLVPTPLEENIAKGEFVFKSSTVIAVQNETEKSVAEWFSHLFKTSAGFEPVVRCSSKGDVLLVKDANMKEEEYMLQVTSKKIIIKAATNKGFFYAFESLRLLLPPAIDGEHKNGMKWTVASTTIHDAPRFSYRGLMLDVARFFMPKDDVKRLIDAMAMLKLNTLHLHLSDDNGWRLEIKKYPRLTEVGAWRVDRPGIPFPSRKNPTAGEKATVGGYYTQKDMKEIIQYAAERQVEVIPEIDIPAHSNAALAAYPQYACPVVKKPISVLPGLGGKNAEIIYCAGNDSTFTFLENVLDEVMTLFPSKYIHLGGDEAAKAIWKKCPLCQKRIREEHLDNEEELQGYFMERMSSYVRNKGKEVMGWDELTKSKLPKDAIVFGWQGYGNAALKAAEQGHRFVMTPARVAYLIRYQGPQWFEPLTYFGNNLMKSLFEYEPVQPNWKPEYEKLLMGVQASMWTEFCSSSEEVFYMVFPRLAALAEVAWVKKGERDWQKYLNGLDNYLAHLGEMGIKYALSMYNIQHHVSVDGSGKLEVALECERPDVEIHYTVDGTEPSISAMLYKQPFSVDKSTVIKAATFKEDKQMGKTLVLPIDWNKATAKPILDAKTGKVIPADNGINLLVNGVRGSKRQTDFEWYTGAPNEPVAFVIDLQKEETLNKFSLGSVSFFGMGVHKPRSVKVEVSADGKDYKEVGNLSFTDKEIFQEGRRVEQLGIDLNKPVIARYVRFTLEPAGLLPKDHVRSGQIARFYVDEVVIE